MDTAAARSSILFSIRSAYAAREPVFDEFSLIPRNYLRVGQLDPEARLNLFVERLREYDAGVHFASADNLSAAIAKILAERDKHRLLIPDDFPSAWLPSEFQFTPGNQLDPQQLDSCDGVLTGCTVGIALTGTLVLQNAPTQGPRALSLVPDYHLCVIFPSQLVETVPEAFDRLKLTELLPITFISGPSATADIEMTRIKGVHAPRSLDVLVAS